MLDYQLPDPEHSAVDYVFRVLLADEWVECPRCGGVANVFTWALSGIAEGICEENGDCEWSWEEEPDYS